MCTPLKGWLLTVALLSSANAAGGSWHVGWGSLDRGILGLAETAGEEKVAPGLLTLVNESGAETVLSAKQFAQLPRQSAKAKDHSGALARYEGVALAELLRVARVPLGSDLKGARLANCILVEARDGYRVVFSLPEVDPGMTDHLVLVADAKDGKPLDARDAPYRLIVPQDKRYARWVRQVTRISIRGLGEVGPKVQNK
jgi:hypothetical protein